MNGLYILEGVPDFPLVKFDHYFVCFLCSGVIRVLHDIEQEILQCIVDSVVPLFLVYAFDIGNNVVVEQCAKRLVLNRIMCQWDDIHIWGYPQDIGY